MFATNHHLAMNTVSRVLKTWHVPFKLTEESQDHAILVVHLEHEKKRREDLKKVIDLVNQVARDHQVNVLLAPAEDEVTPITLTSVTTFDPTKHPFALVMFVRKPFSS